MAKRFMFRAICHPKTTFQGKDPGDILIHEDWVGNEYSKCDLKSQTSPLHYSISDINEKVVLKSASNTNNLGINIQSLNPVLMF